MIWEDARNCMFCACAVWVCAFVLRVKKERKQTTVCSKIKNKIGKKENEAKKRRRGKA
jgi:hypothetical protein